MAQTIAAQSPSERSTHIISLLNASGSTPYIGEPISQLEHSLQCAHQAATSTPRAPDDTILAALLHDIGQFVPEDELTAVLKGGAEVQDMNTEGEMGGSVGRVGHEELGARYLNALGFDEKITKLVGNHVAAKRYLCAVDSTYHDALSDASKKSLMFQGGPMDKNEVEAFESDELCRDMVRLRRWDDGAKIVGLEVQRAEAYGKMMETALGG
jgi:putative nucleotidyltransferase with HDIG domain